MPPSLLDRFRAGDRLALARLVTLLSRGESVGAILDGLPAPAAPSRVVALTGAGGVGKSSLAGRLTEEVRRRGPTVAVLACDPESPLSGGALLGDRFRMSARPDDDGVFIRSLAAAGGQGALANNLGPIVRLLEAFGFGVVLIETVGAGQGDTAVCGLVDAVVLLLQPETGDDLQWEKAGLLEVADVVAVHKADLPGADRVLAQVVAALGLSPGAKPVVLPVSARSGAGVAALWDAVLAVPPRRGDSRGVEELFRLLRERLQGGLGKARQACAELAGRWQRGELSTEQAVTALGEILLGRSEG